MAAINYGPEGPGAGVDQAVSRCRGGVEVARYGRGSPCEAAGGAPYTQGRTDDDDGRDEATAMRVTAATYYPKILGRARAGALLGGTSSRARADGAMAPDGRSVPPGSGQGSNGPAACNHGLEGLVSGSGDRVSGTEDSGREGNRRSDRVEHLADAEGRVGGTSCLGPGGGPSGRRKRRPLVNCGLRFER